MYAIEWIRGRIESSLKQRSLAMAQGKRRRRAIAKGIGPGRIACLPGMPRPVAQLSTIASELGFEIDANPEGADALVFWPEDPFSAFHRPPESLIRLSSGRPVVNIGGRDMSKTNVARVFEEISGTPLLVDPETYRGRAVEKPEGNGIRGGRIVECPTERIAGFCYERLIENLREPGDRAVDVRPAVFGDGIPYVIYKERFLDNRLGVVLQPEITPLLRTADDLLSDPEQKMVLELARRLGADWCEIDCCRDKETGILFPVDVNTTPSYFTAFEPDTFEELVRIQAEAFRRAFLGNGQPAA